MISSEQGELQVPVELKYTVMPHHDDLALGYLEKPLLNNLYNIFKALVGLDDGRVDTFFPKESLSGLMSSVFILENRYSMAEDW